jgi:hypothetical protein
MDDPNLLHDRKAKADPNCKKSRTDSEAPRRATLRKAIEAPS